MRHKVGEGAAAHTLRGAEEDAEDRLVRPRELMDLPLAALVLRRPPIDLNNINVTVDELSERDEHFIRTLLQTPSEQESFGHSVIFGYLLDYCLL